MDNGSKVIDLDGLESQVDRLRATYHANQPFPHIVLDNFLTEKTAESALQHFPKVASHDWMNYKHYNSQKFGLSKRDLIPNEIQEIIDYLNDEPFIGFLEKLTGLKNLKADETLDGGGLHQSEQGGYLNVHADFMVHPKFKNWKRRINLLVYLNKDWKEEYGGHLELWTRDMKKCEERVLPVFNRCVIFSTSEESYHGHPEPVNCPEGMSRKSVALYYFTEEQEKPEINPTNYKARPQDKRKTLIALDNKLLRTYKRIIHGLNLDDSVMNKVINFFSGKRS